MLTVFFVKVPQKAKVLLFASKLNEVSQVRNKKEFLIQTKIFL